MVRNENAAGPQVEKKLFTAVDELSELNDSMKRNNLEQRRRQLRDIFMKFDVDFESKIQDPTQVRLARDDNVILHLQ